MYPSLRLPWSTSPSQAETLYRSAGLLRTKGTIFLLPPPDSQLRVAFNNSPRPKTRMSSGAVALCKHFERRQALQDLDKARTIRSMLGYDNADGVGPGADDGNDGSSGSASVLGASRPDGAAQSYRLSKRKEGDAPHPYWPLPTGSNDEKTATAEKVLDKVLAEAVWRNVMLLHSGVAVYEIRVLGGWGMRWTLAVERDGDEVEGQGADDNTSDSVRQTTTMQGEDGDAVVLNETNSSATVKPTAADPKDEESLAQTNWKITRVTFRGLLEPIAGLDHEL
ncbi:uncharacterized protein AB675_5956 [Cyphellophora attinorum]|uniref:Uncharacterized protein n=1 Tax=Cyphellophora attinorum TaxID=1664694 RepID=A0A0N1HN36_9EURO|nr:uncharacterized protein AB675_5956 [Phialophora attinorum]KPI38800.1 hypothetical protein AB675_5956 [Phialophora attinorum]